MANISKFTKKPKITYTPEDVLTPEVKYVASTPQVETISSKSLFEDYTILINEELAKLQQVEDQIVALASKIVVPVTMVTKTGNLKESSRDQTKSSINISDYISSFNNKSYGAIYLQKKFEEACLDIENPDSVQCPLFLMPIYNAKNALINDLNSLEDEFIDNFYTSGNPNYISHKQSIFDLDLEHAEQIRTQVARSARLAKEVIQKCVSRNLFMGSSKREGINQKAGIANLLRVLKSMRAALVAASILYATDWKSVADKVRAMMQNYLVQQGMAFAEQAYWQMYNKIYGPIDDYLSNLNDLVECPLWGDFVKLQLDSLYKLNKRGSTALTDFFDYRSRVAAIGINSTKKTETLIFAKKWLPFIDGAIIACESLLEEGVLDVKAIKETLNYANSRKPVEARLEVPADNLTDSSPEIPKFTDDKNLFVTMPDVPIIERPIGEFSDAAKDPEEFSIENYFINEN